MAENKVTKYYILVVLTSSVAPDTQLKVSMCLLNELNEKKTHMPIIGIYPLICLYFFFFNLSLLLSMFDPNNMKRR